VIKYTNSFFATDLIMDAFAVKFPDVPFPGLKNITWYVAASNASSSAIFKWRGVVFLNLYLDTKVQVVVDEDGGPKFNLEMNYHLPRGGS
jgi:hypothetical protein